MAINLIYKHQQKTYKLMKEELKRSGKAAYVYPTGCGKSFPLLKYIEDNIEKNALIVVPSLFLKNQYKKYIKKNFSNGEELLKNKQISIITYKKLSLLMKKAKNIKPGIIAFDEAHKIGADTYEIGVDEIMEKYPNAEKIAFSATPERTDGRNMLYEKFGENIVYEMSLTDALSGEKEGEVILGSPRYIRVFSQMKPMLEEYKRKIESIEDSQKRERLLKKFEKLDNMISDAPDIQDIMAQGMKKKNGKYIVFCKDRDDLDEKMRNAHQIFAKVNTNIKMDYVLSQDINSSVKGKTSIENRRTLEKFENREKNNELQLLFCVDMLNEGNHIAGIDGEIMFRETESAIVYKQQAGRVMEAGSESGSTVIIDAVNNWLRQLETFKEFEQAIGSGVGSKSKSKKFDFFKLSAEELDFLDILREIQEETKYNYFDAYDEIIKWLDSHDGKMPRKNIFKNGKVVLAEEKTEAERYECVLRQRFYKSVENKILNEYFGRDINEVPEEYREKISKLRSYGIGVEKKNQSIETLLNICEVLVENGVDISSIKLSKKQGKSMYNFLLKELNIEGIDIDEIIRKNNFNPEYNFGNNMKIIRQVFNGTKTDLNITDEQICRAIDLGIIHENVKDAYKEDIRILELLKNNGVNLNKGLSKREKSGRYFFKLYEINQDGIDIEKIISDNLLDREYVLAKHIHSLKYAYNHSKYLSEEQRKRIEELGIVVLEKKNPYLEHLEKIIKWKEQYGDKPRTKANPQNEEEQKSDDLAQKMGNLRMYVKKIEGKEKLTDDEKYIIEEAYKNGIMDKEKHKFLVLLDEVEEWQKKNNTKEIPKARNNERKLPLEQRSEEYLLGKRCENLQNIFLKKYKDISDDEFLELDEDFQEIIIRSANMGIGIKFDLIKRMRNYVAKNVEFNSETRTELNQKVNQYLQKKDKGEQKC